MRRKGPCPAAQQAVVRQEVLQGLGKRRRIEVEGLARGESARSRRSSLLIRPRLWSFYAEPHAYLSVTLVVYRTRQREEEVLWQWGSNLLAVGCSVRDLELLAGAAGDRLNAVVIGEGEAPDTWFGPSFAAWTAHGCRLNGVSGW